MVGYERRFLLNSLPLSIEKFEKQEIKRFVISDNMILETSEYGDKIILYNNDKKAVTSCDIKNLDNFNYINIIRYKIPLSATLIADLDIVKQAKIITVVFNTKEEAVNFEVPNYFGEEILRENSKNKVYTKKEKY